jgi:hypothetical protein
MDFYFEQHFAYNEGEKRHEECILGYCQRFPISETDTFAASEAWLADVNWFKYCPVCGSYLVNIVRRICAMAEGH